MSPSMAWRPHITMSSASTPSGKVAVNPDGTLNRASMQTITNPDDMNALEAALKMKDATGCVKLLKMLVGEPFRPMVVASIRGSSFKSS